MVTHIYTRFLQDDRAYRGSEAHWARLWEQVDPPSRERFGWQQPWFEPLPRSLGEGNPIFSAVSRKLRRGIRVIQHEPTQPGLEVQAWQDYFGGDSSDRDRIEELVISCALSDRASEAVFSLWEPWVKGEPVCFVESQASTRFEPERESAQPDRA